MFHGSNPRYNAGYWLVYLIFSARLPSDWKVDDASTEGKKAAFFGPPIGPKPFSQLIGVYYHIDGTPERLRAYLAAEIRPGESFTPHETVIGQKTGLEITTSRFVLNIHSKPQLVSKRVVVVPTVHGFYSLEHTWPIDSAPTSAFEEFLRSFKSDR